MPVAPPRPVLGAFASAACALALAPLMAPALAAGTFFSCSDAQGHRLRGQEPPQGCVGEICETNPVTGARECRPPPETPEQRRRREAAEKRTRDCQDAARKRHLEDSLLLERYPGEESIERERDRELAAQDARIRSARARLAELEKGAVELDREAEFYASPKHPMPQQLQLNIDGARAALAQQREELDRQALALAQINERYDAVRQRRQDVLDGRVAPPDCDPPARRSQADPR